MKCSEQQVSKAPALQATELWEGEGPCATRCTHEFIWFWACVICKEGAAKGKTGHGSSSAKEKHKRRKLSSQWWVPALTGEMRVESSVDTQGCPSSLDVQVLTVFIVSVGLTGYNQVTTLLSLSTSEFPPTHPVWPLCICQINSIGIYV